MKLGTMNPLTLLALLVLSFLALPDTGLAQPSTEKNPVIFPERFDPLLESFAGSQDTGSPLLKCSEKCLAPIRRFIHSKEKYCAKVSPKAAKRYKIEILKAYGQCMNPFEDNVKGHIKQCLDPC